MLQRSGMDHEQQLTEQIIGCAIEVHRALGPGLLESAYIGALAVELAHRGISFDRQRKVPLEYRGVSIGDYQIDLIVENKVVVEIKSVVRLEPVFGAQVLTYLKISQLRVGLLLNFNKGVLKDGIKRFVL
jgi:GxxExxY protein